MPICIYCKSAFDKADGEHVLQNFLGSRFTSDKIVCNEHQREFGHTIDVALERGLQPIRNLFGTRGGRRGEGPTLRGLRGAGGERIDFGPGGNPRLAEPIVEVVQLDNGSYKVRIKVGAVSQLGWSLAKLRQQIPNLTVNLEQVRSLAQSVEGFHGGQVELPVCLGGRDYFRAVLKACLNLVGAYFSERVLSPSFDSARKFVLTGKGDMMNFARWSTDEQKLPLPEIGMADHFIGLVTRGASLEGVVQFFGDIIHSVRLSDCYSGEPFSLAYVVDPFREADPAELRNPHFEERAVPEFEQQLPEPGEAVWAAWRLRLSRTVSLFYDRADQQLVTEVIDEVLRPHEGEVFTKELAAQVAQTLAERFAARICGGP